MCPSFLATRDEKDSTRGRARVLQELANGSLVSGWSSEAVASSLDLCLSCKGCASDCPTGIDMATYKAEALYQRYRRKRRPASHYALGWLPRWASLATSMPGLANLGLRAGPVAALGKRLGGIDARRPLPVFAKQSFRKWFAGRTAGPGRDKPVLLWVDTFTNAFAPEVGQAAVRVLEAAGYTVQITPKQVCCGLTWISTGQLDGARRQLRRTLRALGPALAADVPIVGLEPSCTVALRHDAARLLPETAAFSSSVKTLSELLTSTDGWTPPDLSDVTGVAQPHCHQHAVLGWDADATLLREARRAGQTGGRLLRAGGQLRRRARALRRLGRGRRNGAAPGRAIGWPGRDSAGRRFLLPHPTRPPRRRSRQTPSRTPRRSPQLSTNRRPAWSARLAPAAAEPS